MHGIVSPVPATSDRELLRFVACGSVDDGKSTLIGRLLIETGSVSDDQLAALAKLSRRYGTTGDDLDCALLLDGLESEREQGITIDVAYRYFGTKRRAFVVADTPGHEQYTRNMVTGASNADVALLLVDVRHGLADQTMRHSRIAALLGIRHIVLVANKMDLVDFSEPAFAELEKSYREFAASLGFAAVAAVPVSARDGDNVASNSARMPWYKGPTVLELLETIDPAADAKATPPRYVVQSVIRADNDFRGLAGFVASGSFAIGDTVALGRSGESANIARIVTFDGDQDRAETGQAVTLVLDRHRDAGRGDILAPAEAAPQITDQFAAHLVWLDEAALLPGRTYMLRLGTQSVSAAVTSLRHKVEIETGGKSAGRTLELNDIGFCNIATATPVALDPYADNRATGAFILIDRTSGATVGAGMVAFSLRRASNVQWQDFKVNKATRALMKAQRPCIVWFTGLSGAGKSTIMNLVEQQLVQRGFHTYALDGDNVRHGLNQDLGFTDADRVENVRRVGHVAKLMVDAGLVVLCAFISPFEAERKMVRDLVEPGEFFEVFVDTPLSVCLDRDPKGLYAKARAGKVQHVTGLDSPYERPEHPELRLLTDAKSAEDLASDVIAELGRRGILSRAS